jgi:hypothetical protein
LIEEAGLSSVNEDYDFHIIFYGVLTEDGEQVDDEPCCLWGGGNSVALNNGWNVRERGPEPFEGFLHEWLHVVEGRHGDDAPEPLSTGGLHGAQETVDEDGSPTSQWLNAYRRFMRSQVAENRHPHRRVLHPPRRPVARSRRGLASVRRNDAGVEPPTPASVILQL